MAKKIIALPSYHLPKADRRAIISGADTPNGKIHRNNLLLIARQRQSFVQKFGNDGVKKTIA